MDTGKVADSVYHHCFEDVHFIISFWQRQWNTEEEEEDSAADACVASPRRRVDVPSELGNVIGLFRGWRSGWHPLWHGPHLKVDAANACILRSFDFEPFVSSSDGRVLVEAASRRTAHVWKGNTAVGRCPLPRVGRHTFAVSFAFDSAHFRTKLQNGYFFGVVKGPMRKLLARGGAVVSAKTEATDSFDFRALDCGKCLNHSVSHMKADAKESVRNRVTGVLICDSKVQVFENGAKKADVSSGIVPKAHERIALTVDMDNGSLQFFCNETPIFGEEISINFESKNGCDFYALASIWHSQVSATLHFDDSRVKSGYSLALDSDTQHYVWVYE